MYFSWSFVSHFNPLMIIIDLITILDRTRQHPSLLLSLLSTNRYPMIT